MKRCKCGYENHDTAKFCSACGAKLGVFCPSCHTKLASNAKFCSNCGNRMQPDPDIFTRIQNNTPIFDTHGANNVSNNYYDHQTRNLTVTRTKAFFGCLGKAKVYIEDPNSKDILDRVLIFGKFILSCNKKYLIFSRSAEQ